MASVILGDWTHRRGDAGRRARGRRPRSTGRGPPSPGRGARSTAGRVDQVRVVGHDRGRRDDDAARRRRAALGARRRLRARRAHRASRSRAASCRIPCRSRPWSSKTGIVHVVATRRGEPIFWYALTPGELVPQHRLIVVDRRRDLPGRRARRVGHPRRGGAGLWLELDVSAGDGDAAGARLRVRRAGRRAGGDPS